jgi:hypothetical protein
LNGEIITKIGCGLFKNLLKNPWARKAQIYTDNANSSLLSHGSQAFGGATLNVFILEKNLL